MENLKKRILLVEDENVIAKFQKIELIKYNYIVEVVNSGEDAITFISGNQNIDLILMDINLGLGIEGTTAAKEILKIIDIPIIFLSSHIQREIVEKTEEISSYGYVLKNSGITVLDASIKMAFKLYEAKRKTAEKERLLEKIAENYPNSFVIILDKKFNIVFASGQEFRNNDINPSEYLGANIKDTIKQGYKVRKEYYEKTFKGEECSFELEIDNGTFSFRTVPLFNENNEIDQILAVTENITERKQNENKLKASEENLKLLVDNSIDVIWKMDPILNFTYVSPSIFDLTGYTQAEWTGTNLKDHATFPEFTKMAKEAFSAIKSYKTFKQITFEAKLLHKNGKSIPVEISGRLTLNKKGIPIGIQGSTRNITVRKKAEEKLAEYQKQLIISEKRFVNAMKATKDGLYDWNIETNEIYYNPGYFTMLGYAPNELPHTFETYSKLLHPDDAERSAKLLSSYLKKGKGLVSNEIRLKTKSGKWLWVLSRGMATEHDKHGKPIRFVGTNVNIDDRKKAEEALRYAKNRSQQYLEIANIMLIALDKNQNIILINPRGCEVLRYEYDEIIYKNWFDYCIPEKDVEPVKKVYTQILSGELENFKYYENHIIRKDGVERLMAWNNSILYDEDGNISGIFSSGEDITEKRAYEEKIRESEELFRTLFEQSTFGIALCELIRDQKGKVIDFIHNKLNNAAISHTGYNQEMIVGKKVSELLSPELAEKYIRMYGKVVDTQQPINYQEYFEIYKKHLDISVFPLYGDSFIINFIDITDRIKSENKLKDRMQELEIFYEASIDRELIINNLRKEVNMLLQQAGKDIKYFSLD